MIVEILLCVAVIILAAPAPPWANWASFTLALVALLLCTGVVGHIR